MNERCLHIFLMFLILLAACGRPPADTVESICDYVDPFIGTDDMGHTYPGAVVPFGMVQLSPETDTVMYSVGHGYNPEVYRYCSGYQYDDATIVGFSHTHFSGTGHSDLGDIRLMPMVGEPRLNPGTADNPDGGYRSRFTHRRESARPGCYSVSLDDYGIEAELTATERVGFHRYTFPRTERAHLILDLTAGIYNYEGKTVWVSLRVENDTLITGSLQTTGWARSRSLHFAAAFSKPVVSYRLDNGETTPYRGFWRKWDEDDSFPERAGRKVRAWFRFDSAGGGELLVKVALSSVDTRNARRNMEAEIPGWDFDGVKRSAGLAWERELSRIAVDADEDAKVNFYTSLYHAFLSPNVFSDVNGEYLGLDRNIQTSVDGPNYTVFSLWDTYRALHPLFTLLQQERTNGMIRSMLAHYDQSVHRILPIWSHHANENWCMIGYHAVPVIADAYLKEIRDYDVEKAFQAVVQSADYDPYDGIAYYKKYGYVPEDLNAYSASKTLEYAYDDWTISRMAGALGRPDIAEAFRRRAGSYENLFDGETGFIRARNSDGGWKTPFDPLSVAGQGYIEGNAWNYSLYVPHDPAGLIRRIGGEDRLAEWLDTLFEMDVSDESIAGSEDVTRVGMIGNYVHGNEPSHHIPYLYVYAGRPWKTQERIRQIMDAMYRPAPDGLCGNDDCGQMSAWYIFSALGFYPVCPGSGEYVIGTPCVDKAVLRLENGGRFTIEAENRSAENLYIQSVSLDGKTWDKGFIRHEDIVRGGTLVFTMGPEPNRSWARAEDARPFSMSRP